MEEEGALGLYGGRSTSGAERTVGDKTVKEGEVLVTQSCLIFCDPRDCTVHGILQARMLEWVAFAFSRGIFPTQESNQGLLHCRRIFYQLNYHRS